MEKIPVLLILALIALAVILGLLGYKLLKLFQAVAISLLLIVFAAFVSRIFRPASI